MNSLIRNFSKSYFNLTRHLAGLKVNSIRTNSYLRISLDRLIKSSISYEKNSIGINYFQTKLRDELKKTSPVIYYEDLKELFYLSKTDADIDLLADSILVFSSANNIQPSSKDDYSKRFMELLYLLRKSDKLIEYYNKKEYSRLFINHRAIDVAYQLLYDENRYDDLIKMFKSHLKNGYSNYYNINNNKNSINLQAKKIPASHLNLVTKALLKKNSIDSFSTFKEISQLIHLNNDYLIDKIFMLRFIYLSINMNNGFQALNILNMGLFDTNETLKLNLNAIIFSKVNKDDLTLRQLKKMFYKNIEIYPFTFKCLKNDSQLKSSNEYKSQMDILFKKAILDSRLANKDLPDIIMMDPREINDLVKLHNFTTDADELQETDVSNESNDFQEVERNNSNQDYKPIKNNSKINNSYNNYNNNNNNNNNNNYNISNNKTNIQRHNKYFKKSINYNDEVYNEDLKTNKTLNNELKKENNQNENVKLKSLGDPLDVDVEEKDGYSSDDDEHTNNNSNKHKKTKSFGYKN